MMTLAEFHSMLDGEIAVDTKADTRTQQQQQQLDALIVEIIELLEKNMGAVASETVRQFFDSLDDLAFEVKARKQIEAAVLAHYTSAHAIAKAAAPVAAAPAQVESAFVAIEDSDAIARTMRGQLAAGKRKGFILAGNAIFTVRSKATQTRFTYKVQQSDPAKCRPGMMPVYFVSLLNGADNTGDFAYIGTIFADGFRVTRKSRVAASAPSAIAFSWLMKHLEDARVEVWHEGRCGRCGRTLTVPESIESGIGPICATK
jgi:hypothetical protein